MTPPTRLRSLIFWLAMTCTWLAAALPSRGQRETARLADLRELAAAADFHEVGTPLGELVERVGKDYGVALATEGAEVTDQKIILYAKQQPVGALLDQVAET